jgi:hypothetical protein
MDAAACRVIVSASGGREDPARDCERHRADERGAGQRATLGCEIRM